MSSLKYTKIGTRLLLAFAALIAIAAVVVAVGIARLAALTDSLTLIGEERMPKVQRLGQLTDDLNLIAQEQRNALLWEEPARIAEAFARAQKAREHFRPIFEAVAASTKSPQGLRLLDAVNQARGAYGPLRDRFTEFVQAGEKRQAVTLLQESLGPAQEAYIAALNKLEDHQVEQVTAAVAAGKAEYAQARLLMVVLLGGMVAVGTVLAWAITRSLTRSLGGEPAYAADVAREIAQGNLSVAVALRAGDQHSLLATMEAMRRALAHIVGNVRQTSDSIATGSAQIATGNADLSQRTEEQASNLQHTASSMEQMNTSVGNNAGTAQTATRLAGAASEAAARGGVIVGQVVTTMQEISESSRRIADIIGVIDGIAFQTNILALNAAVEAARAGDQGRGFAVVASEVRALAKRSGDAAKEIKALIGQSVDKVADGSALVGTAGTAMQDIVAQVKRVEDLMSEIDAATREQTQGIGHVNQAISQLDQVTQQNAALVEESAAAADSLRQQAQRLLETVKVFRVDGLAGAAAA